jgi:uncharacterized protein (TIGR02453 family)
MEDMMSEFNGFPKEMIAFFNALKKNNRKEWFEAHKDDYENYVKGPAGDFVVAMGQKLQQHSPRIMAIPKVNQSLFRINRDTRFSHDKTPYKTNLGIWFWQGERKRMECSGFYFHLGEGTLMLGTGMHIFSKENLERYRKAVVHKTHGPQLKKTVAGISRKGYIFHGSHYKKVPRGFDANHKFAEFLLYNGLTAMIEEKIPKEFYSGTIVDYAYSHFKKMYPLHEWLLKAVG